MPPSPTAASLGKAGLVSSNLSGGEAQVNIPIYNTGRTGSAEASSMIGGLQSSNNNFTIIKGNTNRFDYNPSQRVAAFANQLQTDPSLSLTLANTPAAAMKVVQVEQLLGIPKVQMYGC